MRISDWSSDVCSSDLHADPVGLALLGRRDRGEGFGHGRQIAMSRATCHPSPLAFRRQANAVSETERGPFSRCPPHRLSPLSGDGLRSEEHTSELQSLMRISYAVFCLKKKKTKKKN